MTDVFRLLRVIGDARRAKVRVLRFFLRHPSSKMYPARLANLLQISEPSVRRALHSLVKADVLVSRPTRYRHYFRRR